MALYGRHLPTRDSFAVEGSAKIFWDLVAVLFKPTHRPGMERHEGILVPVFGEGFLCCRVILDHALMVLHGQLGQLIGETFRHGFTGNGEVPERDGFHILRLVLVGFGRNATSAREMLI